MRVSSNQLQLYLAPLTALGNSVYCRTATLRGGNKLILESQIFVFSHNLSCVSNIVGDLRNLGEIHRPNSSKVNVAGMHAVSSLPSTYTIINNVRLCALGSQNQQRSVCLHMNVDKSKLPKLVCKQLASLSSVPHKNLPHRYECPGS